MEESLALDLNLSLTSNDSFSFASELSGFCSLQILQNKSSSNFPLIFLITIKKERFNPSLVNGLNQLLDQIEKGLNISSSGSVLIVTGTDKFFSTGLDLGI